MRLILLSLLAYGAYSVVTRVMEENAGDKVLALPSPEMLGAVKPKATPRRRRNAAKPS